MLCSSAECCTSLKSHVTVGTRMLGLGLEAGQQQNAAEDCFLQREDISSPLSLTPPFSDQRISPLWGLGSSFLTVLHREGHMSPRTQVSKAFLLSVARRLSVVLALNFSLPTQTTPLRKRAQSLYILSDPAENLWQEHQQ